MRNNTLINLGAKAAEADKRWEETLGEYVKSFHKKKKVNYFAGNSLGLHPKRFKHNLLKHANIWKKEQHNGHFYEDGTMYDRPWWRYQEKHVSTAASLLGAHCHEQCPEVALFGTLSANNKLLVEIFAVHIRDTLRVKNPTIVTIKTNFPSDDVGLKHALKTVFGNSYKLVEIPPTNANGLYEFDAMVRQINREENVAMGFFPGLCYTTGQRFPIAKLTEALHAKGAIAGFDLAHSMGNYQLHLHNDGVDFATFCGYKYLNGGPGSVGGIFVHEKWFSKDGFKNHTDYVSGWFGVHMDDRFRFNPNNYRPAPGAWGFLQSNDQIFNMQGVEAYFELVKEYGKANIFKKQKELSQFMQRCLSVIPRVEIITPRQFNERGSQTSFYVPGINTKTLVEDINRMGNFCEQRGNFIRVTPVAYNTFNEVWKFCKCLNTLVK